ncbi:MAG: minor capsid protein, partial [Ruminococcus sp.]|nr:minor capsid protein [Ruminococcus sp.]
MFIDDVYSGGKRDASSGNTYPLLSEAIKSGLFHPNCKYSTSTYYEGITTLQPVTEEEQAEMERREQLEQQQSYYENQAKKNRRIAEYSLDADNKRTYSHRAEVFEQKAQNAEKVLAYSGESGIILTNIDSTVANGLHYVGTIDKKLYSCVTKDISTDELIITEKQIEHIFKNHPTDFIDVKDVIWNVREAVSSPDYIVESEKPNTAFVLKE